MKKAYADGEDKGKCYEAVVEAVRKIREARGLNAQVNGDARLTA